MGIRVRTMEIFGRLCQSPNLEVDKGSRMVPKRARASQGRIDGPKPRPQLEIVVEPTCMELRYMRLAEFEESLTSTYDGLRQ